ncbi:MAG: DUF2752 domain-containing protein [Flavobacteriales bacterium]|nr:DUF2752 domain-containing protein [Flavobacteriales bacterium]MDG1781074.1 DUF2752 domain-containing protein [Flavobacteriales bacterium]MDG2246236.1 DUF2752 domain-containing protein [Flavobacteriales bacterium]
MLKCSFKSATGFDCPGCGLQRSVLALLEGDLVGAFVYWPTLFPLLAAIALTAVYLLSKRPLFMTIAYRLYIVSVVFLLGNWLLKMTGVIPCPV